ncbi:MAG: hypothetical protein E7356_01145 [Clostridiales bacterium]|nr:hypothetical protein [Clostridiales bacterium]
MKKRLFSILAVLMMAFSICLVGCGDKGLKDNPPTNTTVISNFGMSAIKGDYLYYINGYVDETTLDKKDNKEGEVTKGAIYRTKLNNGEIVKDSEGFLVNSDRVVSKVVGFSNGGFAIMGDYIYYTTPCMEIDKNTTELQSSLVEFHRVNINGTKDERLYTTSTAETNLDWTLYNIGGTPYIVVYEGSKIVSINTSSAKVVGTVENSTSYAILEEETYKADDSRTAFNYKNVIFTRDITAEDNKYNYKGNAVCAMDIATGNVTTLKFNYTDTITIKAVNNQSVYYTKTDATITGDIACLYKKDIVSSWDVADEHQLTDSAYDNYYFVNYGADIIIATRDNATWKLEGSASNKPIKVLTASRDLVGISGDYGYYVVDGDLIRFNIHTENSPLEEVFGDVSTLINNDNFIDFDGRYVYTYGLYTSEAGEENYYLTYFESNCTKDTFKQRFVGVFEDGDVPAVPEQPEPEYDGQEVERIPHID